MTQQINMNGLTYDTIIAKIKTLFPEFVDHELTVLADDMPGIYLTFLPDYVREGGQI